MVWKRRKKDSDEREPLRKWGKEKAVNPQRAPRRKTHEPVVVATEASRQEPPPPPPPPPADSGQDGDGAPPPEAFNEEEEVAKAKACGHCKGGKVLLSTVLRNVRKPRFSGSAICEICRGKTKEQAAREGGGVLVCLDCSGYRCAPRHAREHAKKERHWVAVSCSKPHGLVCFKCDEGKPIIKVPKGEVAQQIAVQNGRGGLSSGSAIGHVNPVKGIPNRGRTCYVNALLQCLLALDGMRAWMLEVELDPADDIGKALKKLFVAATGAGDELEPDELLETQEIKQFEGDQDSHELLLRLRKCAPAVFIDDIFLGRHWSVKKCESCGSSKLVQKDVCFYDLSLPLAPKERPAKCPSSPVRNRIGKSQRNIDLSLTTATKENKMDKIQRVACVGDSQISCSKLKGVGKSSKPLEVDCTEAEQVGRSNDSNSHEDCLIRYLARPVPVQSCDECSKAAERPNITASKYGERMTATDNENTTADIGQSEQSDSKLCQTKQSSQLNRWLVKSTSSDMSFEKYPAARITTRKEPEYQRSGQDPVICSIPEEKQSNPLSNQCNQNATTVNEDNGKQEFMDGVRTVFRKLPCVLMIHLMRYTAGKNPRKVRGHVSFSETLDVGDLMDPSSKDKASSRYRLVGVIEHRSKTTSLREGHFVAYVRANMTGSQKQQRSAPSAWFYADDSSVEEVSLDEVLKREANMLFYERIKS